MKLIFLACNYLALHNHRVVDASSFLLQEITQELPLSLFIFPSAIIQDLERYSW
jgi:hypothetical protein